MKAAFLLLAGGFFLHSASAQEFKTNDEGNRVYIHEDGDEYCWDCYPTSPWTEQARHFLAGYFPASLRTESPESAFKHHAFNCAGGAAQAGVDVMASGALWAVEPVAYILEPFDPKKTKELLKRRWNQAGYGFYYVWEGELFELIGEKTKQLARHIIRSVREKDSYSLCEMAAVAGMFFIGPKVKTEWAEDAANIRERQGAESPGMSVQRAEQNSAEALRGLEAAQKQLRHLQGLSLKKTELDETIAQKRKLKLQEVDEQTQWSLHISGLEMRKNRLRDSDSDSRAHDMESLDQEIAAAQAKLDDLAGQPSVIESDLSKALAERQALRDELAALGIEEGRLSARAAFSSRQAERQNRRLSRALQREEAALNKEAAVPRAKRVLMQTAKTPKYTAVAIVKLGAENLPYTMWNAFALPFVAAAAGVKVFALYGIGRFLHEPDEESLEDYLNALSVNIDSP